jgi:aldehyde dehydrogenase (NAD+)
MAFSSSVRRNCSFVVYWLVSSSPPPFRSLTFRCWSSRTTIGGGGGIVVAGAATTTTATSTTTTTTTTSTIITPNGSIQEDSQRSSSSTGSSSSCSGTSSTKDDTTPFDITSLIATLPTNKFYINGSWVDPIQEISTSTISSSSSSSENTDVVFLDVIDPSTAAVVASVAQASVADVNRAVTAARDAWIGWSYHTTPAQRQTLVQKLLLLYRSQGEALAQLVTTEMGSPIHYARSNHVTSGAYNIQSSIDMMEYFAFERSLPNIADEDDRSTTVLMESVGAVGMITPWNWPLYQITLKVIPALLVGCTVVLKPSEQAPLSALLLTDLFHHAGFPPGVINVINGNGVTTGSALTNHPSIDMLSFTGSSQTGKVVAASAAMNLKRTSLELGGKGANILFADIGDEWMKEVIVSGVENVFANTGQTCNAPTRMFVERPYYDVAIQLAKDVAEQTIVQSGHREGTDHIGPVVSFNQYQRVQNYIQMGIEEGATLIAGGLGCPDTVCDDNDAIHQESGIKGYYVRPTVFANCHPKMTIMQEEIFGPVVCITPFDTEDEVLAMANDTPYGLTNYVQTRNIQRRKRFGRLLQSGMVQMNDAESDYGSPFGGMKGSGTGREGGIYGLEEFCIVKTVTGYDEMDDDIDDDDDDVDLDFDR